MLEDEVNNWIRDWATSNLQPGEVAALVERLDSTIVGLVPDLADRELQRDLHASTAAQIRSFLVSMANDAELPQPPPEARALARSLARRGLEMRVLMNIYHAGQRAANQYLSEVVAEQNVDRELERALLFRTFERSTDWLGMSLEMLTVTFAEERESSLRDEFTRRAETVRSMLSGDDIDSDVAARRLGYPLSGNHLAFVLWSDDGIDGDVIATLGRLANKIASAFGTARALTVPSGATGLWAWLPTDRAPGPVLRDGWTGAVPSVRAAFGAAGRGVAGFRRSHREAVAARHLAEQSGSTDWLTEYLDVEIVALASADDEGMRALVARELAWIDGLDANSQRLRETLHAYIRNLNSPDAAARSLGVHKNTVRYRIQRIEELLGHDIASRRVQLEVALECVAVYGPAVL